MSKELREQFEKETEVKCTVWDEEYKDFILSHDYAEWLESQLIRKNEFIELKAVIDAWEKLSEGHYSPKEIEKWLHNDMKPVIDVLRNELKKQSLNK